MKKIILEILMGLLLPTAILLMLAADIFSAEKSVNKQISFSIARDSNYDGAAYDMELATVRVIIFKVRGQKQIILWDKVFDTMQLKKYPLCANALCQTVNVKNICDRKEKLFVTYIVTYSNKGSIMQLENGTTVAKGVKQGRLSIVI
jgi:hypothetical protein